MIKRLIFCSWLTATLVASAACGDDADGVGVGAECTDNDECNNEQACLVSFKGGYCSVFECTTDSECVEDAACVTHSDGSNYCFRTCADKADCNANRSAENEANCASNVVFVEGANGRKACVPPSAGG